MSDPAAEPALPLPIASVERDCGLSKDTLRVWERRYGFPQPVRDAAGVRAYPADQVAKLRLLKRLVDAGHRPARIVALDTAALERMAASAAAPAPTPGAAAPALDPYLGLLRSHHTDALRRQLALAVRRLGLARFVREVAAPLNTLVGEAWMRGDVQVYEEHLYTEAMGGVLREAIRRVPAAPPHARPRVLLTTVTGEPHGLGLLMAEAMLALEAAPCVPLGVQTPLRDIVAAARAHHADIVALSFTGCLNAGIVVDALTELRARLPRAAALWAGGSAPVLARRVPDGVRVVRELDHVAEAVRAWRATHGAPGLAQPAPADRAPRR